MEHHSGNLKRKSKNFYLKLSTLTGWVTNGHGGKAIFYGEIFKGLITRYVRSCLMILTFLRKIMRSLTTCILHGNFNIKTYWCLNKVVLSLTKRSLIFKITKAKSHLSLGLWWVSLAIGLFYSPSKNRTKHNIGTLIHTMICYLIWTINR